MAPVGACGHGCGPPGGPTPPVAGNWPPGGGGYGLPCGYWPPCGYAPGAGGYPCCQSTGGGSGFWNRPCGRSICSRVSESAPGCPGARGCTGAPVGGGGHDMGAPAGGG